MVLAIAKIDILANGLPGEYILSDQWRNCFRNISPVNNPAILTEHNYFSVYGVMSFSSDDVSVLWEKGLIQPLGLYRSVALSVIGENGKSVKNVSDDFLLNPHAKTEESASNSNYTFFLSYASNPFGKFNYGLNLKGMSQGNFGDVEYGLVLDFGISYRLLQHPVFGYHLFGLTLFNIFSPDLSSYSEMRQPLSLSGSYNVDLFNNRLNINIKGAASDLLSKKSLFTNGNIKIEWDWSLLLGIRILPVLKLSGCIETDQNESISFWSASAELNIPQVNLGRDLSFIYQYRNPLKKNINGSHSVYYRLELGKHREEIYARKSFRNFNVLANDLYNKAMKLYFNGNYWDAYFIFKQLLIDYQDFHKNDNCSYYGASCLEKMDFREAALSMFNSTVNKYSKSKVAASSNLGIMRIHYRNADYHTAISLLDELNRENVPDSILRHGYYIAGESNIALQEYQKAIQYLSVVPETHPDYCFAQYSIAVARLLNGQELTDVIYNLENCISSNIESTSQEEIRNKAYLALGFIYYEEQALSKAVVALRLVPKQSIYYEDALLALGWTAIKARQWNDCIEAGISLVNISKRQIMKYEGQLIQAYGYTISKKYKSAYDILKAVDNECRDYSGTSADTVFSRKFMYGNTRLSYNRLSSFITPDNVLPDPDNEQLNSYHKDQINMKNDIDNYLLFTDEINRLNIFEKNLENIKEDISFAFSKIQRIMLNASQLKANEKLEEKDRVLDDEINNLKDKVIQLNNN